MVFEGVAYHNNLFRRIAIQTLKLLHSLVSMLDHKKPARWQATEARLAPRVSAAGADSGENSRIQRLTTHRIKIPGPSSFPEQARSEGSAICSFAERLPGQKLLQVCFQSADDGRIRIW